MAQYQLKDFASIAAAIINYAKATQSRVSDFSVGSVARALLESPAVEIEQLYQQFFLGLREAIPVSIYRAFGFERLAAQPATGVIRVEFSARASAEVILQNTVFTLQGGSMRFLASSDVPCPVGSTYALVPVAAATPGAASYAPTGAAFVMSPTIAGMLSATASGPLQGGIDEESDDRRRARFLAFLSSLSRGTVASLDYAVQQAAVRDASGTVTERPAYWVVVEPYLYSEAAPSGQVTIYVHNGVSPASSALLAEVQRLVVGYVAADGTIVPGYKAAGVVATILAAADKVIPVQMTLAVSAGYTSSGVLAAVSSALSGHIGARPIGAPVYRAELIAAAMAVDGVDNCVLVAPAADVPGVIGEKPMPGAITLSVA